jgi:hypothetical protein
MEPAAGDIWVYGIDSKKLYYLLLECEEMKGKSGWHTLLLALNREARDEVDGSNRIPYDWYRGNLYWEQVA